ncbi:hypothetical protein [Streptomyces sp. NPDC046805]|uniref:hypothetical protein n=1 Tax=Streptomyces sp. NPDC046805 TaxID=3155134 RepID=UPI00341140C7
MVQLPTRHRWLTACALIALAATGLASPAHADDHTPKARHSSHAPRHGHNSTWTQEPKPDYADPGTVMHPHTFGAPGGSTDPADFQMIQGSDLSGRIADLDAALYKQGVQDLMTQANRTATTGIDCTTDPFGSGDRGTPLAPTTKYCWQSDDATTKEWIPQAVSGVSDAQDDEYWGVKRPITVGSYDAWNPGRDNDWPDGTKGDGVCQSSEPDSCNEKGVRITFLDPDTNKYRHVLLVWPYYNSFNHISFDAVHADEDPLQKGIHAGGMVWYGNYLYVADTMAGIRVFDMRDIMDLNPDQDATVDDPTQDGLTSNVQDTRQVGRQNNVWYSYGYRYVMPQVATWKFAQPQYNKNKYQDGTSITWCEDIGAPKDSYLSLDRSTTPDELVMGEYCRPGQDKDHSNQSKPSTGRIAGIPLNGTTGEISSSGGISDVSAWGNFLPKDGNQGAAKYQGKFYLNQSHLYDSGSLWRATITGGSLLTNGNEIPTAVGPEDMYVEHGTATGAAPLLWSVTEHRENFEDPSCYDDPTDPYVGGGFVEPSQCGRVLYAHKLSSIAAQP